MSQFLQVMGALFIFFLMASPFIVSGIYHQGKTAGIEWAMQVVYPRP